MLRVAFLEAFGAVVLGVTLGVCPAGAQTACGDGALADLPVPGSISGALAAAGEPATADRTQFLGELIRSTQSAIGSESGTARATRTSLLGFLDSAASRAADANTAALDSQTDTLPLPLPPAVWSTVVFGGHIASDHLLAAILRSRDASLLYYGLLALDDDTRAWLCGQASLLREVTSGAAARFVLAAPGLRVAGGRVRVPGGEDARPSWEALVGASVADPDAFLRALLAQHEGRLAYFFGMIGSLEPEVARFALGTETADTVERLAAAERLFGAFRRISQGWEIDRRPFRRPPLDPGLLAGDLRVDGAGRPLLPGTRRFWTLVLGERTPREADLQSRETHTGPPVDFPWLCDKVFGGDGGQRQNRYRAVLYASRVAPLIRSENAAAAVEAVRAAVEFPVLTAALERAHVDDPAVVARAARRAAQLTGSGTAEQATRTIAQFQGLLAILVRAAARGALPKEQLAGLVSSLAAVEPGGTGDYEGRLLHWIETSLVAAGPGGPEARLKRLVTGARAASPRVIEWEGTRYRVDLSHGEALRVSTLLGRQHRPLVSSAAALVAMAGTLSGPDPSLDTVRTVQRELARLADGLGIEGWPRELTERYRRVVSDLDHASRTRFLSEARGSASRLLVLADDLLARGLTELVYASALGQPDRDWIAAGELAARHDFLVRSFGGQAGSWDPPSATVSDRPGLGIAGSLLGLDVTFAEFSLVRVSSKPPVTRPTLSDVNRRSLVESVAFVEPAALTDEDRDAIASNIRRGRERVDAVRTRAEADALARELRLGGMRSSLLAWLVTRNAAEATRFFSRGELLRLGGGGLADESTLHAWGAPARSRTGCLCLHLFTGTPERLLGRVNSGVLMSVVPDLNLRLAELLAEMRMPAILLAPVLASATLDLVNTARARDEDDRRGLTEEIDGLGQERMEQYLALLTSDGPLVPADDDAAVPTEVQR